MRAPTITGLLCGLVLLLILATGCTRGGARYAEAQKPGTVTGAGVTFTGPANSAQPSKVSGKRTATYRYPSFGDLSAPPVTGASSEPAAPGVQPAAADPAPAPRAPDLVTVTEEFTAEIGAHQALAGILAQAAKLVSSWTWLRWVGIACILGGVAFAVWSMQNPLGYVMVGFAIAGCGVVFVFASANPAWLLLLAAPGLWFTVQKLGIVRVPEDPK